MIIRDICKFLQSGLISSMRFEEKLGHTNLNPERIYLYIMDLICNDSEHIFRDKTSQKCLFKTFCYNNQGTRKIKDFLKLSYEEIYFTLQSNSTKYIKYFKFISWPNFMERYHNLSPHIWGNIFTD